MLLSGTLEPYPEIQPPMEAEIPGGSVIVIDLLSLFRIIYPGIHTMVK